VRKAQEKSSINSFLKKLDNFDLNEYIKVIKFDKIKIPTSPISLPKEKKYYGLKGYKNSQIDALKQIVLSKGNSDVLFYSNMPMIEASKDIDFTKKFMIGLAFLLKKGTTLNIIHNLDRPFKELMLGLEGWIPLYMTGQINPYYFKNNDSNIYSHIHIINDNCILDGLCFNSEINNSTYYLSNKKNDITNYKEYGNILLKKATPLMDIYNENKKKDFNNFLKENINIIGERKSVLYNLPNYVLNEEFIKNILIKNKVENKEEIINNIMNEINRVKEILKNNKMKDKINIISENEFNNYYLNTSKYFINYDIKYDFEDYKKHLELIEKFKKLKIDPKPVKTKLNLFYSKDDIHLHKQK
jgi:hypothetical protein